MLASAAFWRASTMWAEIDWDRHLWPVSLAHLKRLGEELDGSHAIPLTPAVIKAMRRVQVMLGDSRPDALIFPIGPTAMLDVMYNLRPGSTVHGQRAAFRSWSGACTAQPAIYAKLPSGTRSGARQSVRLQVPVPTPRVEIEAPPPIAAVCICKRRTRAISAH